jgi:hypothetical protein
LIGQPDAAFAYLLASQLTGRWRVVRVRFWSFFGRRVLTS